MSSSSERLHGATVPKISDETKLSKMDLEKSQIISLRAHKKIIWLLSNFQKKNFLQMKKLPCPLCGVIAGMNLSRAKESRSFLLWQTRILPLLVEKELLAQLAIKVSGVTPLNVDLVTSDLTHMHVDHYRLSDSTVLNTK